MSWTPIACQSLSGRSNSPSCYASDASLLGEKQNVTDYATASTPKQHWASKNSYSDKENGGSDLELRSSKHARRSPVQRL